MRVNGYFGVRTVEAIIDGLKHMDTKAEVALFIGLGIAAYGYFKYGKEGKKDEESNSSRING